MRLFSMLALSSLLWLALAAPAAALQPWITTHGTSQELWQYNEHCEQHPEDCARNDRAAPDYSHWSRWITIQQVNESVNRSIKMRPDAECVGRQEAWGYPTICGDCEDLALLKRRLLIERGFAPANLMLAIVRTEEDEGHAVLIVRTTNGDLVLDNRTNAVQFWYERPYTWYRLQSPTNPRYWRPVVTEVKR